MNLQIRLPGKNRLFAVRRNQQNAGAVVKRLRQSLLLYQ